MYVVFICKTQCFFIVDMRAVTIQEKNNRPRRAMRFKMLKPQRKELRIDVATLRNFDCCSRRHRITKFSRLSLAFENHKGRYEVPNGIAKSYDSSCYAFLRICDLLYYLSTSLSYTFIGYEKTMLQSTFIGIVNALRFVC